jgi:predicted AAA+ superfamily ATPase
MISKELLKEILFRQRKLLEERMKEKQVEREQIDKIKELKALKHVVVITGIRRAGKSFFLSQIAKTFYTSYYYLNFEDERLYKFSVEDFELFYQTAIELFGESRTIFLDEVQNIKGWERWVRRMHDEGFKLYLTGSNASLLSKELGTLLTGRHIPIILFPFSFIEFLHFKEFDFRKEDLYITERRAKIVRYFEEYVQKGGFPEFLKSENIDILQGYFNDILQRDIVQRYSVKYPMQLKELARYMITNSGKLMSYNKLRQVSELKSTNTVIKYVDYMKTAYLIFTVPFFSYSLKQQLRNPFKVYSIDVGLRNAISFGFSKDFGRIYENIVALHLLRKGCEVYYWKGINGEEVDFVVKMANKIEHLVQVTYELEENKEREIKSLITASKELKCNSLIILTKEYEGEEKIKNKIIRYIPLWKWLLLSDF